MARLSVNINKLATIRNARGGNNPDILAWAKAIQDKGAHGITIHPRPDERHIRRSDVAALREVVYTEFNIEGYPSPDFIEMVLQVKPEQVTLVPDPPEVLTSNAGWDLVDQEAFIQEVVAQFKSAGIRVSLFMDADPEGIARAARVGTDRIELYTERYARGFAQDKAKAVSDYARASEQAVTLGLGVNAGHDLDLENLNYFICNVPGVQEVSIGHALICDALRYGMDNTIELYLRELDDPIS